MVNFVKMEKHSKLKKKNKKKQVLKITFSIVLFWCSGHGY